METLDYIKLAVSKDKTRYNICSIYRDKNHFVATDGHRMHYANGLPYADPHYIDGTDAQFPDWRQVLPEKATSKIRIENIGYNQVRLFLDAIIKVDKEAAFKLDLTQGKLELSYDNKEGLKVSAKIETSEIETLKVNDVTTGFKARYILDALKPMQKLKYIGAVMKLDGASSPMAIEFEGFKANAIIMPCRFE